MNYTYNQYYKTQLRKLGVYLSTICTPGKNSYPLRYTSLLREGQYYGEQEVLVANRLRQYNIIVVE